MIQELTFLAYSIILGKLTCEHPAIITKPSNDLYTRANIFIGGVHLVNKTEYKIRELGIYLRDLNIKNFYPCHCCDLNSKVILSEYIKIKEVYSGLKLSFD